ncbi:TraB/GumN family protein [Fulvimarina endophytica]|nr:TraB/GumN family protein [Fulvimarina endophytica]
MRISIEQAEEIAERIYRIALAFPLFVLLILLLGSLVSPARAQDRSSPSSSSSAPASASEPGPGTAGTLAACGTDLRSRLTGEQKSEIAAKAAETPAGEGLFWKIEKEGVAPSHLLGTIHLPDPRVADLPASVAEAQDGSERTVLELSEIADPQKMAQAMFSLYDTLTLPNGETLKSVMSEADYAIVSKGLEERGIPMAAMERMQPWFISTSLSMPDCDALGAHDPDAALDAVLASRALADGQEVVGLETVEEQLDALASLPMETQIAQLVATVQHAGETNDMMETMIGLYRDETIAAIMPTLEALFPDAEAVIGSSEGFAAVETALIDKRNGLMVERMIPLLEKGDSFVAVGALHLVGETGIVEGLRKEGWTVTRLPRR